MRPEFDAEDQRLLDLMQIERKRLDGLTSLPRMGDVLAYPDGSTRRVAHSWHDGLQPSMTYDCRMYLSKSGHLEFSGSLDNIVPNSCFTLDGHAMASAWFFHHGHVGAHRGVNCTIEVRRWKYTPA